MLKPRLPQASFYSSYLYDKINQVVGFSFVYAPAVSAPEAILTAVTR